MSYEIARLQSSSNSNYLERWLYDDGAAIICDNDDPNLYISYSSDTYYNSAFFNYTNTSAYGDYMAVALLLSDTNTRVYIQRSTDGGENWTDYNTLNPMYGNYGTLYTYPSETGREGLDRFNIFTRGYQFILSPTQVPIFEDTSQYNNYISTCYIPTWIRSNGGGATHIGKYNKDLYHLIKSSRQDVYIISAGGGGGAIKNNTVIYDGDDAGGYSGSGYRSAYEGSGYKNGHGAWYGESLVEYPSVLTGEAGGGGGSGGGGNLCSVRLDGDYRSAGGGCGYIGNQLLTNKKMVGYNIQTYSGETVKTESVDIYSETPESGIPKVGNGHARITLIYDGWMGEETTIAYSGDDNTLTVQKSGNNIVFTFYSEETSIYSFNSYYGSSVRDIESIYIGFLIDSNQELMKPSFVYETSDGVYAFNQETPTEVQMSSLYNWVAPGLPS